LAIAQGRREHTDESICSSPPSSSPVTLVWHVCHHLIAANHSSTTLEARIMLVQATLEYLSWVKYVLSGVRSGREHKNINAHDHLKELLVDANISKDIPAGLPALQQFATDEGLADGPEVVTRLRNRLVHPKDAREPYRIAIAA
jgi:hypothetical protein